MNTETKNKATVLGTQDLAVGRRAGRTPGKPAPQGTVLMVGARNARETQWSVDVQGRELTQFLLDNTLSNLTAPDSKNYTRHKNPTSRYGLPTFPGALHLHHISKPSYFSQNPTKMRGNVQTGPRSKTLFQV